MVSECQKIKHLKGHSRERFRPLVSLKQDFLQKLQILHGIIFNADFLVFQNFQLLSTLRSLSRAWCPWFSTRIVCNIFIPITLIALATMWTVKAFKVSESISAVCESSPATEDLEASKQNFSSQNYLHIASKCNSTFQDCCQILALYQSCIMPGISGVFSSDNITNWGNIWVRNLVWFILQVCCSALFAK